jgi:hypothetical protein
MHRDALRRFFAARESSLTIHKLRSLCRTIQAMKPRLFRPDTAYLLKSVQYPKEELFNAIKDGLDHAYRQGQISEALYFRRVFICHAHHFVVLDPR